MQQLARVLLALWIGGVACTALVVAPAVFSRLDDDALAGSVMAPIFSTVDYLGVVAAAVFIAASWGRRWRVSLAALLGAFAVLTRVVSALRFEGWHETSTLLWGVILVGGIVLLVLGPLPKQQSRA